MNPWNLQPVKVLLSCLVGLATSGALADPFPPTLANGAAHFPPVAWPAEPANAQQCGATCGEWLPYTRFQSGVADPRTRDPSNGGTAPQNYVNIASSCVDKTAPSVYYALRQGAAPDGSQDTIMFRWRVEQIANTYATGPSAGAYSSSDPWSSALWSVLFDVDGDGYLDLAAHLDGSSGSPSASIDRIAGIWSKRPTQSLDYVGDPTNVKLLAHNPTGFVDPVSGRMLNFAVRNAQNQPLANWPNGSAETTWDYGTTRSRKVSSSPCNEYFIDYQIPVQMLDASAQGGPKISRSTPISMVFCTANSLNNPFQKDCAINAAYVGEAARPAPFGDYVSFNQAAPYSQPIVSSVIATPPDSCPGTYTLTANVQDTLAVVGGQVVSSVKSVRFFYYYDADGNGVADDGGDWVFAANAALKPGSLNLWTAQWSGSALPRGSYLIGVQAVDDNTKVDDGVAPSGVDNRTFSYVAGDAQNRIYVDGNSYAPVPSHAPAMSPGAGENWWGNPSVTGSQVALVGLALNNCGVAPSLSKSASASAVAIGGLVDYTLSVSNTLTTALTLDRLDDSLPSGFIVVSTTGGSLAPTSSPSAGASGTVSWLFSPAASIAPGATATLTFRAQASSVSGSYNNTATASTSFGVLAAAPVPIAVDGVRLSLSKMPSTFLATPDGTTPLVYTLQYSNDSTVAVSAASILDTLPAGVTYVSCSGGLSCAFNAGAVSWALGTVPGGASGAVQLTVTVNANYANSSLVNTAILQATDPAGSPVAQPASATVAVAVPASTSPAFTLAKTSAPAQVAPGANVTWTIAYRNDGGAASGVTISDPMPTGFTFVSCTGGCAQAGGTVSWNLGAVAGGASGSVTVTAAAATPFTAFNPATNTASLNFSGNSGGPVTASAQTGVTGQSCSKYYFRNSSLNVGAGAGTQLIATQATADPTGAGATKLVSVPASSGGFVTALEFYTDPVTAASVDFNGAITSYIYVDRANGPGLIVRTEVFDYDTATGTLTAIGTASQTSMNGSTKGLVRDNTNAPPTFNATGTLQKGHRLLFRYSVTSANTQTFNVHFQYDGNAVPNPISGGTATNAPSRGEFCVTPPPNLSLAKTVNKGTVTAGVQTAAQYTLAFTNTGQTKATGVQIVDTLPAGVTFVSATLNGGAIAPAQAGQQLTFTGVRSTADAVAGEVSGGTAGTVVINTLIEASATGALTNTAAISSTQTSPVAATALTTVDSGSSGGTPQLAIQLTADLTAAAPGQTVTYTVTVINTGTAAADAVSIANPLPLRTYYTYGTCSGGCNNAAGTLTWTLPSLAVGASVSYTFTMVAGTNGLLAGATVVPDQAAAQATGVSSVNSNTVNVTLDGNPSLGFSKSVAGPPAPAPGDVLTYTLQVSNTGSAAASGVQVVDPIPAGTQFSGGIATSSGSGSFDAVNNRVVFAVGSLAAGASATLSFQTKVGALSPGNTVIANTATVSADNAAQRAASANTTATAQPTLTLTKQAPAQVAYPAASLTQAAVNTTVLRVNDSGQLSVGQYVGVGGSVAQVVELSPTTVTLASPVTAANGSPVVGALRYTLTYENTGKATAAATTLSDTLPAGMSFVAASGGGTHAAGTVTWNLGALEPGASGSMQLTALPAGPGTYVNNASVACAACVPANASATTTAGGLLVLKRTTTPVVSAGSTATYVIDVQNTSASPIGNVTVTDVLPSGFTYSATTSVTHDGTPVAVGAGPQIGDGELAWGTFTVQPGKVLTVEFTALVSAGAGTAAYQNQAGATPLANAIAYDFLNSTREDVVVLGANAALISGVVFHDVDNNGVFDAAIDTPLAGVTVNLYDAANVLTYVEVTDAAGGYSRVVDAGQWTVEAVASGVPAGLSLGGTFANPASESLAGGGSAYRAFGFAGAGSLPDLVIAKSHAGNFAQGQVGAAYTLVVSNTGAGPTTGTVTVIDTLPAGLTATAMAGAGWNCTLASLACTRADALAAGQSYPAITVTVTVAANAAAQVTNSAAVSGGGEVNTANNSASDVTAITSGAAAADLAIAKGHAGNFTQGQTGAVYHITVSNVGGSTSAGVVTVTDTLPAGLLATAITGTGWACTLAPLSCTRADPLPAGQSFPVITLVVDVSGNAPATVTNVAAVSGGGDANAGNNQVSDLATITPPPTAAPRSIPVLGAGGLLLLSCLLGLAGLSRWAQRRQH